MNLLVVVKQTLMDPHFWGIVATGVVYIIGTYFPGIAVYLYVLASAMGIVVLKSAGTAVLKASR